MHVNADDAEAVVHATLFALDFRMKFGRDVFIDLLGYRKYGHNEGDEPRFTQPNLYKAIAKHKNPRDIYADQLIAQGIISQADIKQLEKDYKDSLELDLQDSRKIEKTEITPFMQDEWKGFTRVDESVMMKDVPTAVSVELLTQVAASITALPGDKKFLRKIEKLIGDRKKIYICII